MRVDKKIIAQYWPNCTSIWHSVTTTLIICCS